MSATFSQILMVWKFLIENETPPIDLQETVLRVSAFMELERVSTPDRPRQKRRESEPAPLLPVSCHGVMVKGMLEGKLRKSG